MKSCDRIEKLIILSDLNDLNQKERNEIANHIAKCENCSQKVKELDRYHMLIQSLQDSKPELHNASELTESIIGAINELKESHTDAQRKDRLKIQPFHLRIAASFLILIMAGYFTQQSMYVSQMETSLRLTYTSKNANKPLMNSYNECLNYSENFIKDQVFTDIHFTDLLLKLSRKYPLKSYRNYASAICLKSNAEFNNADLEMKKRMVIEMLNSNLNQNH